jgi:preprotein translocase subunit SecG
MTSLLIIIHVLVCALLIALVLIQRGRGGGLVESFSGVESMFGTKTNAFLTRATTVFSIIFFFTCLSLAILSVRQSKSLLSNVRPEGHGLASDSQSQKPAPIAASQPITATSAVKPEASAPTSTAAASAQAKPLDTSKPKADQK